MSRIVVGVPGPWADQSEVVRAVATAALPPRFLAMGGIMMDMGSRVGVELEVHPYEPGMEKAFAVASAGAMSKEELQAVERHRSTVYLVGRDCSLAGTRQVMAAAAHLLDAGGVGVKVESAGVAHGPERWRHHARSGATLSAYRLFVTLVGGAGQERHFSCGMHNFGLPDVSVHGAVPVGEAAEVMTTFNHWSLLERPVVADGTWFSCGDGEPAFTAGHRAFGYEDGDLLNNSFGRWHLTRSDDPPADLYAPRSDEPLFMALRPESLIDATRKARATMSYFKDHFRSPFEYGNHLVKVRLTDGEDSAFFWTLIEEIDGDVVRARLFEVPRELASYRRGQVIELALDDVQDWAIIKSGTLVGGFSMRVQRSHIPEARRAAYDRYSGTLSYAPLEEIPGAVDVS